MYSKDTTYTKYTRYKYIKYLKKYCSFEQQLKNWHAFGTLARKSEQLARYWHVCTRMAHDLANSLHLVNPP